jgi:hypothetical protein
VRAIGRVDAAGDFALAGIGTGRVTIHARQCDRIVKRTFDRSPDAPVELDLMEP